MSDTAYLRPDTLDAALEALAMGRLIVAAGCTDLFPATERKVLPGRILDITAIPELRQITVGETGVTLGATATWSDIIAADLPSAFDGLKLAAREVGARQIQNQGTIAGNICNASPAADGVPPLLTLDAEVSLASVRGLRRLSLHDFLKGPRHTARDPDEIVTAIEVPAEATRGQSHFMKLGARSSLVISITMTAAHVVVDGGLVTAAALAVGAAGPVATRIGAAERALIGAPLDPESVSDDMVSAALSPIDDVRADAAYRAEAAAELMRRTLAAIAGKGTPWQ